MAESFIIISGVPGTGKTTFSKWLSEHHGYIHHEVDFRELPTHDLLEDQKIVIDWGFPANEPQLSRALRQIGDWKASGAELWWFDGDREEALKYFTQRGTVSRSAWNYQMKGMKKNWEKIQSFVGGRSILTVCPSGHLTNEEIYEEMISGR